MFNFFSTPTPAQIAMLMFIVQLILVLIAPDLAGHWLSPVFTLLSSIISTRAAFSSRLKWIEKPKVKISINSWLYWLPFTSLLFVCAAFTIPHYKLEAKMSDVIPTVQLFCSRLLNGKEVYVTITEFGYYLAPTYLPMHWLPYLPSELIGLDPRWWSLILFTLLAIPLQKSLLQYANNARKQLLICSFPAVLGLFFMAGQTDDYGYSVELMIVGYYLLLMYYIEVGGIFNATVSLVLILLSRFSILFWLPLGFVVAWKHSGKKSTLSIVSLIFTGVLLIYIIPFLSRYPDSFQKAQAYYTEAAVKEWDGQDWQKSEDDPYQISRGLGFAWWFYKLIPGNISDKIILMKFTHIFLSLFLIAVFVFIYLRGKFNNIPFSILLGGSLQMYLWVFYSFIQVPYPYLFMVPLGVSLAWVLMLMRWRTDANMINY